MNLNKLLSRARSMPLSITARKLKKKLAGNAAAQLSADAKTNTDRSDISSAALYSYFTERPVLPHGLRNKTLDVADRICSHRFSLLGSPEVEVKYNLDAPGIVQHNYSVDTAEGPDYLKQNINPGNLDYSQKILKLLTPKYQLIDWQIDFRSGWRWDLAQSSDIVYGNKPGADIKIPWELGRMQHLLSLWSAWAYSSDDKYLNEYCNQLYDFIASNPPGYGTQWMSSMDIAIRAVNLLISYDLFKSSGATFGPEFESIFLSSVYDHGKHMAANLEWSDGMRGNHYLSDIVGLFIIGSYLQADKSTLQWLAFGLQELMREPFYQFYFDGSNFEGSMTYHLLTAEMMLWSHLILNCLGNELIEKLKNYEISGWQADVDLFRLNKQLYKIDSGKIICDAECLDHMDKIIDFAFETADNSGNVALIGDNDSGRFLRAEYTTNSENHLNELRNALLAAHGKETDSDSITYSIVKALYSGSANSDQLPPVPAPEPDRHRIYPDFALGMFSRNDYHLLIRCGALGQNGKGGHDHNDRLSIWLSYRGQPVFVDPGSYAYTNLHDMRNKYRSVNLHNTLIIEGMEQNEWFTGSKDDLFWMNSDRAKTEIVDYAHDYIKTRHHAYKSPHERSVSPEDTYITVRDKCSTPGQKAILLHLAPGIDTKIESKNSLVIIGDEFELKLNHDTGKARTEDYMYSPGYGRLKTAKRIIIEFSIDEINWKILFKD